MFAITCALLEVGQIHLELSYFSKESLREGSIISVPLRGKSTFGLVLTCVPVSSLRQNIKESSFQLKKLSDPKARIVHSRAFLRASYESAMWLACPPGALIASLTPTIVLSKRIQLPEAGPYEHTNAVTYEKVAFSHTREERLGEYRRLARESLAREKTLVILTPTVVETERIAESLRHGIKEYVEVIHGSLTPKKMLETWTRAVESTRPLVLVGTLMALSIPRNDIATIVLEREGARAYVRDERPYTLGKTIAEATARAYGARFILAGTVSSVESSSLKVSGEVHDIGLSAMRMQGVVPRILDLREHKKIKGVYDPLMPETLHTVETALREKKKVLVLSARKGLAPQTVCDDCGTLLTCKRCTSTLVLHANNGPKFLCHHCGAVESASVRCRKCSSWRLTTLGIAIDKVAQSLTEHFENTSLAIIGSTTQPKEKESKVVEVWNTRGGILLSTERVVPYLPDLIETIVVASIDSFLSIPEYSTSERVFTLLCELRSRAEHMLYIQTRDPGHRVIKAVTEGVPTQFFRDELTDRKKYAYPPFATLIKITSTGKKEAIEKEIAQLERALAHFSPTRIDGRIGKRGESRVHLLLRLPPEGWVDQRLLRFLRALPRSIEVRINPLSIHTD